MKYILLRNKGIFTLVDDDDYKRVNQYRWAYHKTGYAIKNFRVSYNKATQKGKTKMVLMHRFILNALPGQEIDHINHNKLDNRKKNLRIVPHKINMQNLKKREEIIENINFFQFAEIVFYYCVFFDCYRRLLHELYVKYQAEAWNCYQKKRKKRKSEAI